MVATGTLNRRPYGRRRFRGKRCAHVSRRGWTVEAAARRKSRDAGGVRPRSQAGLGMVRLAPRRSGGRETESRPLCARGPGTPQLQLHSDHAKCRRTARARRKPERPARARKYLDAALSRLRPRRGEPPLAAGRTSTALRLRGDAAPGRGLVRRIASARGLEIGRSRRAILRFAVGDRHLGGCVSGGRALASGEIVGRARGGNQHRRDAALARHRRVFAGTLGRTAASTNRMKICYLDAFSGISGDMTVGALVDAGADAAALAGMLDSFETGAGFRFEKTARRGIAATKFHVDAEEGKHHRHLPHILELIEKSALPERAKKNARAVFQRLGEAEAKVHGIAIEKVHFHE